MNIALIGPPGAGKGTHADELCERYGLTHLSTGKLFRKHLVEQTALGLLARRHIREGTLVSDEIVDAMVEERVRKTPRDQGILFDGFPRTMFQARFLTDLFDELGDPLDAAVYLNVSDDVIVDRLQDRWICRECQTPYHLHARPPRVAGTCDRCGGQLYQRDDDHPEIVHNRLSSAHHVLGELTDYYREAGNLIVVDGDDLIPLVQVSITDHLDHLLEGRPRFATPTDADRVKIHHRLTPILAPGVGDHPGLDLVLVGGPGSGKGTQAALLEERLQLPHIASGDLFRHNLQHQTALGKLAANYIRRGDLVPDDLTFSMVHKRLQCPDTEPGFILDGFPRNLHQAHALARMMNQMGRRITGVLYIEVSDEEIVRRITGRLVCRVCQAPYHRVFQPSQTEGTCDKCGGELYQREDDNEDTVKSRLKTFHSQTQPLIDFYRQQRVLFDIEGEGTPEEVSRRVQAIADALDQRKHIAAPK